ncbi:SDR family NAD(P)-dependent oxidoreductase [Streptomyces erythrochromogenes]|uniref:SDR family NAD(P)-dependent oxidoreductase n=1 Tax=Streptomyces erythrochromogenes TaxID=285574 RepID=UPI003643F4B0
MTILITGSSSGIGAAAAVELTARGHTVLVTGRSADKLADVHGRMLAVAPRDVKVPDPIVADFSALDGVRSLAATVLASCPRLDALVNNAAVQPSRRRESADGFELGFAVNHLAPFLLTGLLLDRLHESGGRVITTSSSAHTKGRLNFDDLPMRLRWTSQRSYARSKLANILFTAELARRTKLAASSFHPGSVSTDLNRESPFVRMAKPLERFIYTTPQRGAQTLTWLTAEEEGGHPSALYYVDRAPAQPSTDARDPDLAARLWDVSTALVDRHAHR